MIYRCSKCTKNGGQSQQLFEAIYDLKNGVKQLSQLKETLGNITKSIIPEIQNDVADLKSNNVGFNAAAALPIDVFQTQSILSEMDDRKEKENNIIIMNIPECPISADKKLRNT